MSDPDPQIAAGLQKIRLARRRQWRVTILFLPVVLLALFVDNAVQTPIFSPAAYLMGGYLAVFMAMATHLNSIRCPRCGHSFSQSGGLAYSSTRKCNHCALPLYRKSKS